MKLRLAAVRLTLTRAALMGLALSLLAPFTYANEAGESLPRYEMPDTAVHVSPAPGLHRQYQVWVSLPASYAKGNRTYPVVFVADANYSFPLVNSIRNRLGAKGQNIEDFILVGLSYADGDSPTESRSRDYTPTDALQHPHRADQYGASHYGEAAAYRDYVSGQVFPLIARTYRADMSRRIFVGHSYGGLFGAFVLLTRPDMFQIYVLSSPSLQYDNHVMQRYEADYAKAHKDLAARVLLYDGSYEVVAKGPRYNRTVDMVQDAKDFEQRLKARAYPHLTIERQVIADEDHLSVYPAMVSRALLKVLPGSGPYTGG